MKLILHSLAVLTSILSSNSLLWLPSYDDITPNFWVRITISCRCQDLNFFGNLASLHNFQRIDHHRYWLKSLQIFCLAKFLYNTLWENYSWEHISRENNRKTILLKMLLFFLYDSLITYMESERNAWMDGLSIRIDRELTLRFTGPVRWKQRVSTKSSN